MSTSKTVKLVSVLLPCVKADEPVIIRSKFQGKAIAYHEAELSSGNSRLVTWKIGAGATPGKNFQWYVKPAEGHPGYFQFISVGSGLAINIADGKANNTAVLQLGTEKKPHNMFKFLPSDAKDAYGLCAKHTADMETPQVIAYHKHNDNGDALITWSRATGADNFQWYIEKVTNSADTTETKEPTNVSQKVYKPTNVSPKLYKPTNVLQKPINVRKKI